MGCILSSTVSKLNASINQLETSNAFIFTLTCPDLPNLKIHRVSVRVSKNYILEISAIATATKGGRKADVSFSGSRLMDVPVKIKGRVIQVQNGTITVIYSK